MLFNYGSFSDVQGKHPDLSRDLWDFLNQENVVSVMKAATIMERAALEPLQADLLHKFTDIIRNDRIKQMIGRMVRQIMEAHGATLLRSGVQIKHNTLFKTAAKYQFENGTLLFKH